MEESAARDRGGHSHGGYCGDMGSEKNVQNVQNLTKGFSSCSAVMFALLSEILIQLNAESTVKNSPVITIAFNFYIHSIFNL